MSVPWQRIVARQTLVSPKIILSPVLEIKSNENKCFSKIKDENGIFSVLKKKLSGIR
jgi:hypothetical protein